MSKTFASFSLKDVSLSIAAGDYFMLLGPSGAGKSLLLELIAGLEQPASGQIFLDGIDITRSRIQHRDVGIVFQDLALFPHLSVKENILYPVHARKMPLDLSLTRMEQLVARLEIGHLLERRPATLSGGERQRAALARVLMYQPKILLLDEPLSSLDVQLRDDTRALLRSLNNEGQTILHVTHDYSEAVSLASHIAVIHEGMLIQQGPATTVFENPVNEFVARFVGAKSFQEINKTRH